MTLLSLFALVLPAALVAPKASKRETQLADQREREIQQNTRLLETAGKAERSKRKARLAGARDKAWRHTERLSPIEQTLTVQPISPATALAPAPRLAGLLAVEGAGDDEQALNPVRSAAWRR